MRKFVRIKIHSEVAKFLAYYTYYDDSMCSRLSGYLWFDIQLCTLKWSQVWWPQTGKLGRFRRDLGSATAIKSKGRGEKSDPGAGSRAARGAKSNAARYMSNEHRYLKSILFNYYAGHGTGVPCVCRRAAMLRRKAHGHSGARKCSPVKSRRFQGRKNLYLEKNSRAPLPNFPVWWWPTYTFISILSKIGKIVYN